MRSFDVFFLVAAFEEAVMIAHNLFMVNLKV
jgi:hypothetical protein